MAAPVTVSERDLRTLLGIVSDARSDLPAARLPLSLLAELKDQVRCDALSFFGTDSDRQMDWFGQDIPPIAMTVKPIRGFGSISGTSTPAPTPSAAATCAA